MATLEEDLAKIRSFSDRGASLGDLRVYQRRPYVPPISEDIGIIGETAKKNSAVLDSISADEDDLSAGRLESAFGGFIKGAGDIFTSVPKAFGESARLWDASQADTEEEARRKLQDPNWLDKLGKVGDEFFANITDINPEYQEETQQKFSTALGSAVGFLSGGVVGALSKKIPTYLLPAFLGAASTGVAGVEDYRRVIEAQGGIIDPKDERNVFLLDSAIGTSEAVVYTHALGRLNNLSGGAVGKIVTGGGRLSPLLGKVLSTKPGRVATAGFVGGLEEFTQEVLSQLGTNYVANGVVKYDPGRELFVGTEEAGKYGFAVGATLNVLLTSLFGRKGRMMSRADIEARAKNDLEGLGLDDDIQNSVIKDAEGNLIRPLDSEKRSFRDKEAQSILERYSTLVRARTLQAEKDRDVSAIDRSIESLIVDLRSRLNPDERGSLLQGFKREEFEGISEYIDIVEAGRSLKNIGTQQANDIRDALKNTIVEEYDLEQITLKPVTKERIKRIAAEDRAAIKALHKRIAENAAEKGFDINKTIEEIELSPIERIEQEVVDEETLIESPETIALRRLGVDDVDIALGNIPDEPITEINIIPLNKKRSAEISAAKKRLSSHVTQDSGLSEQARESVLEAIRRNDFSRITQRDDLVEFYENEYKDIFRDESEESLFSELEERKSATSEKIIERARKRYPEDTDEQVLRRLYDEFTAKIDTLDGDQKGVARKKADEIAARIKVAEEQSAARRERIAKEAYDRANEISKTLDVTKKSIERRQLAEKEIESAPPTRGDDVERLVHNISLNEVIPENLKSSLIKSIQSNSPLDFEETGLPENVLNEIYAYQAENDAINRGGIEIDTTQSPGKPPSIITPEGEEALREFLGPVQRSTPIKAQIAQLQKNLDEARVNKTGKVGEISKALRQAKKQLKDLNKKTKSTGPEIVEKPPTILDEEVEKLNRQLLRDLALADVGKPPVRRPRARKSPGKIPDPSIGNKTDAKNVQSKKTRGERKIKPRTTKRKPASKADSRSVIENPTVEEAARIAAGISVTTREEVKVPEELAGKTFQDPRVAQAEAEKAGIADKTHVEETADALLLKPNEIPVFENEVEIEIARIEKEIDILEYKIEQYERALRAKPGDRFIRKRFDEDSKALTEFETQLRKLRNEPDQIEESEFDKVDAKPTHVQLEHSSIEKAVKLWEAFVSGKKQAVKAEPAEQALELIRSANIELDNLLEGNPIEQAEVVNVKEEINKNYGSVPALHDFILKARKGEVDVVNTGKQLTDVEQKVLMERLANVELDDAVAAEIARETKEDLVDAMESDDSQAARNMKEELAAEKEASKNRLRIAQDNAGQSVLPEEIKATKSRLSSRSIAIENRLLILDPDVDSREIEALEKEQDRIADELEQYGISSSNIIDRKVIDDIDDMPYMEDRGAEASKVRITQTGPIAFRSMLVNYVDETMLAAQEKQINNFIAKLDPEAARFLDINFIRDLRQLDPIEDAALIRYINKRGSLPNGIFIDARKIGGAKGRAYIFGQIAGENSVQVLMHEVVGHFGMRTLFGKDWENFLSKVYMNDFRLATNIYEHTSERWNNLLDIDPEFKSGKHEIRLTDGSIAVVSNASMRALSEEYIADLAKRFANKDYRANMAKSEMSLIRRVFAIIKHLMKKIGLGIYSDKVTEDDLAALLSESYTRIFKDPILNYSVTRDTPYMKKLRDLGLKQNRDVDIPLPIPYSNVLSSFQMQDINPEREVFGYDTLPLITVEEEERLILADEPIELVRQMNANVQDIAAVERLRNSNFASTNRSAWQQWLTRLGLAIENSPALSRLNPLGKLEFQRAYIRLLNDEAGKVHQLGAVFPHRLHEEFAELNNIQQEAVFDYMTTKGADKNAIPTNQKIRDLAEEAKEIIVELGRNAKDMGLLSEESFVKNMDSYLPRVYLKYLQEGKGHGRTVSFMNYLKKEKNLPQDIRNILEAGRVKNPSIIIPDTIATIARDQAILRFFDNLTEASRELGADWVLRKEFEIDVNEKKWYIPDAEDHVQDLKNELAQSPPMPLVQIQYRQDQIIIFEQAIAAGKQAADTAINARAQAAGFPSQKEFLTANYEQLPNTKRYGKLRNAFIRKEIYNDIKDSFEIFDPKSLDKEASKWFGQRGVLVKLHSHWKGIKVLGNIPSWFRNGFGNLALLDISSRRNSLTLSKWVMQESVALAQYETGLKPKSKWLDIAFDNGAFASTYASQELVLVRENYLRSLQPPPSGLLGRFMPGLSEGYFQTMQFLSNRYGDMEGIFKTVRIKDHILEWEEQSGRSFDSLKGSERSAVIDEAVFQANQAVFDYSKVTNFVRLLRKYPLGSPFLTFSIKSFPQVIRSFVRRPQKFLKYALLPMFLHQMLLATHDLDDDDYEQIQREMPLKAQELSSVVILPIKDANDRWQYVPMDYFLPWAPWINSIFHVMNNIDTDTIQGMAESTLTSLLHVLTEPLGFLGGPIPQAVVAWTTGVDPFTDKPIVDEGASPIRKLNQRMTYAWGMAMPSWLTNYGFLGKLLDNSGIPVLPGGRGEHVDRFGRDKETGFQVGSRLFGLNVTPVNREVNFRNNKAKFDRDIRLLEAARTKLLKEHIPAADKAKELRDINAKLKTVRQRMQKKLYG